MNKKTNGERMAVIETKVDNIEKTNDEHGKILQQINDKLDNLDVKFASKWVEKALIGIAVTLITTVLIYVFTIGTGGI